MPQIKRKVGESVVDHAPTHPDHPPATGRPPEGQRRGRRRGDLLVERADAGVVHRGHAVGRQVLERALLVHARRTAPVTTASLLEVALKTGRTHQIRVHLAAIGAVVGLQGCLMVLVVAAILGAVVGGLLIVSGRGSGKTALPFGTFLAVAAGALLGSGGASFMGPCASGGAMTGVALGGLGVGGNDMQGLFGGGLGIGGDDMTGVFLGGLGVGGDDMTGVFLGGLGVGGDRMQGLMAGGLGVGGDDMAGVMVGGLGVGGDDLTGVMVGGLGVGGDHLTGIMVGGLGIGGDDLEGAMLSSGYLKGDTLRGLGTGAYTNFRKSQGLSIGIFNRAEVLKGIQIGLLNYAGNNPDGLKWLPGINAHF